MRREPEESDDDANGLVLYGLDFTHKDFLDAVKAHAEERHSCGDLFEEFFCTRTKGHKGCHAAAVSDNSITAIWEYVE